MKQNSFGLGIEQYGNQGWGDGARDGNGSASITGEGYGLGNGDGWGNGDGTGNGDGDEMGIGWGFEYFTMGKTKK